MCLFLMLALYCLDYYSFIIYFEVRYDASSIILFVQDFFGDLGSFLVSYKLEGFFFFCIYFCKKCQNFSKDCMESVDYFG